ncbi:MAG: hypothetical protein ACOC22_02270 [bacterium]
MSNNIGLLGKVIKEGVTEFCPNCKSSAIRNPDLFGNKFCININCHYHNTPILANVFKMNANVTKRNNKRS